MISKEQYEMRIQAECDFILNKTFQLETGEIIKPVELIRKSTDEKSSYRFRCENGKEVELALYVFSEFSFGKKEAKGIFGERMTLIE